jgi:O-antigen/teichoic acid export membrane protein
MQVRNPRGLSKSSRMSFLLKDSVIYGGAAAISKSFSIITFPLIARHFSTAEYGIIDLFGVVATLIGIMVVFGQDSAVARYFYEYEETDDRQQLISQSILFQLSFSLVVVAGLLLWAKPMSDFLVNEPNALVYLKIVILQSPLFCLMNFSQNLLKWTFQRNQFLFISLGSTFLSVLLLLAGFYLIDIGIEGLLWIGFINYSIFGLLGLWLVRTWLVIPRNLYFMKELLIYAFPIGVMCVVGAFLPTLERWLTSHLLGLEELGLYGVGIRIATIVTLFVGAFQTAWGPFSLSLYKQSNAIETYNLVLKGFVLVMVPAALFLGAASLPVISMFATERYVAGAVVVFPLAMALVIQATGWITEIGIGISKRSYLHFYAYVAYVIVTVAGIYILAPMFGLVGVATGVILGHMAKTCIVSWLAQAVYPLAWCYEILLTYFILAFALGGVGLFLYIQFSAELGSVAYFIFSIIAFFLGVFILFSKKERERIVLLVSEKIRSKS